jgi:hypothetical protein
MVTENVAQGHTTIDEEKVAIAMNWQFSDSNNNRRGGLKKVQMNQTLIIFLRKGYGSAVVHSQS